MTSQEFKQRFMPFYKVLYRVAYHLTGNPMDAEDLLQDTFYRLWTKRDSLAETAQNEAYLITLMRNLHRDKYRLLQLETIQLDEDMDSPPDDRSLERMVENQDELQLLKRLIEHLPDKEREVMTKHLMEEKTYEEIESETGLTQGYIRLIVHRAKAKLKEQLKKQTI